MRRTRIACILIFIFSVAAFTVSAFRNRDASDRLGPEINMDSESITVPAGAGDAEILAGVTAVDRADGDVTSSLIVESLTNFIDKGRRNASIVAIDSDNHVTRVSREIIYSDYHSPLFSLTKPLRFPKGTDSILTNISASDMLDGDLTDHIRISEEYRLTNNTPGEYPMVFTVMNSAGDISTLPVTVTIYDPAEKTDDPAVQLSAGLVNVPAGTGVDLFDYVSQVTMDGVTMQAVSGAKLLEGGGRTLTPADMVTEGSVDYGTPGVYEVKIGFTDSEGRQGSERMLVVVY